MSDLIKATFLRPCSSAFVAPLQIRLPLISIPIKLRLGCMLPRPTAYSPLPQANSSVIGLLFLKNSFHVPLALTGYSNTFSYPLIASNLISFFCPMAQK